MAILIPHFDLAEKIGSRIEVDAATVGELVKICADRYGESFREEIKTTSIVVNGRSVSLLKGKNTRLTSADSVWLLKPSGGG